MADPAPAGIRGNQVTTLREGHQQIPVLTRRRLEEGARLAVVRNLYVYPSHGTQSVPMTIIASTLYAMETQRIRRLDHFRRITVQGFPVLWAYGSQVMNAARPGPTRARQGPPARVPGDHPRRRLDLKIVKWDATQERHRTAPSTRVPPARTVPVVQGGAK